MTSAKPEPPEGLLASSVERWDAFWSSAVAAKVDPASDLSRLVRWIHQSDEYDRVSAACRDARLVKGSTGQPVLNPLIGYLAQLEAQLARTEAEFGMTPASRSRLPVTDADAQPARGQGDPTDEITRRREERRRKAAGE